ncbi:MAG: EF-P beta-lysylation protein EpmB [Gammaproteobacteria bacterium]|nr:MAG: EF-P beta-lysylation protein EpmB [Gammaproteobacteria bacterium]RKZ41288.1 MAG: EF-P beta-lysylation protein EpmB [Gammaproteobacteria bacterium]RKZ75561.1 MAG: EF-P beta-lysylation protein EpmB [Gammaproteobacteria bacterium]
MLTNWQMELQKAIHNPAQLLKLLKLPNNLLAQTITNQQHFGLRVPKSYVARMRKGDPDDPLLRQVLPLTKEHQPLPGFSLDPVGDINAEKVPCLLHKYQGRVLWITTGACAIHCRYCFRQHYHYSATRNSNQTILDAIRSDSSITEVILSGGDPLVLTDNRLSELAHNLAGISHIQRLRLHTRLPIILPERVNDELLAWLTGTRLPTIMVVHANHPNEIDTHVNKALLKLVEAGMTVLNQSVLLQGINDDSATLIALSEKLFNSRVLPYYLHLLDRVQGAAHFEVSLETATPLLEQMRIALPGYLVPKLVREVAGMPYKQVLAC